MRRSGRRGKGSIVVKKLAAVVSLTNYMYIGGLSFFIHYTITNYIVLKIVRVQRPLAESIESIQCGNGSETVKKKSPASSKGLNNVPRKPRGRPKGTTSKIIKVK
jgi:hypothetical protein